MVITNIDAITYDMRYYEYLIKQKQVCPDSDCAACHGDYFSLPTCQVCAGSNLEQRLLRKRTDTELCTCNDEYYDNGDNIDCS